MKLHPLLVAAFASLATGLGAAPLLETTAVHTQPDAASPAISVLSAGTEPVTAPGTQAPAGWTAVSLPGPHEVFVANKDINKALEARPGAAYRTQPKADAPALALAEKDDPIEITGLRGKWTQITLSKPLVGYIHTGGVSPIAAPAAAPAPEPVASSPFTTPLASAPVAATTPGTASPGHAVDDGGSSALPRLFQGKVASTRSAFRPRRPYDYQLNDDTGVRYAYLDVSRLLATEQIDKYFDRTVVVYGTAQAVPGSKDMVIIAESLQLR